MILNISVFTFVSLFTSLTKKSTYNLDEDFLVYFFVDLGVANNAGSGFCLGVGISRFLWKHFASKIIKNFFCCTGK